MASPLHTGIKPTISYLLSRDIPTKNTGFTKFIEFELLSLCSIERVFRLFQKHQSTPQASLVVSGTFDKSDFDTERASPGTPFAGGSPDLVTSHRERHRFAAAYAHDCTWVLSNGDWCGIALLSLTIQMGTEGSRPFPLLKRRTPPKMAFGSGPIPSQRTGALPNRNRFSPNEKSPAPVFWQPSQTT